MTGASLCCDPLSWFMRAHFISNPSAFILGKPGLGKSTIARRWAIGYDHMGINTMFLGDVKGEHVDVVRALGGQVIAIGPGKGSINVLDPGGALGSLHRVSGAKRDELHTIIQNRRGNMVRALITISRGSRPSERERNILSACLDVLDERFGDKPPLMSDLLQVLREAPAPVRAVAVDRGDLQRYQAVTEGLESSLISLSGPGLMGDLFSHHTSEQIDPTRPVVFDISAINEVDQSVRAAALMACWDAGFCAVDVNHLLATAGLEPLLRYFLVLDELWSALRSGPDMVERVDQVTRLNRSFGVGQALISHTMSDLLSLPEESDRMKARGFVERSGMVVCGGLPQKEIPLLNSAISMSQTEASMLASWQDPPSWDTKAGVEAPPPGRGNFLVKVGGRPGIPFHLDLTAAELHVNDTNKLWHEEA
ncbi:ATP/GTP-binding protein [Bifidobacterium xylocopae]|uniref:ATP/GTP-binding protein n=2 Tax=Bifidobacterium xylocopae TaxID=2493119 RepID=A0A366KDR7_9BIFI|nr:ATP/GTP-binding protein [Bifidobacterium xylocopae]